MKYPKHEENTDECSGCLARIEECHKYLQDWFSWVKKAHPTVHCAWGFRDEDSQNEAYKSGASKLQWPNSKHNRMNGRLPESAAIDLFEQVKGIPKYDPILYAKINEESEENGWGLRWGGTFRFKDYVHFEIPTASPLMKLE